MKNRIFFIFCFISLSLYSQQKYQNLLWKISGNGLKGDSYLYGTMHISSKVAYRLDDVFYKSLLNAETIALESDPNTWLESSYEELYAGGPDQYRYYTDGFYPELFRLELPEDIIFRNAIRLDNNIINAYLYRKDYSTDNFEEETYLDMFIYQAGRKNRKAVVALEDLNESRYLTTKAILSPTKKNPDPWMQKLIEKENLFLLQENAYRDRNLDLLDSIGSALNTEVFREYMLYRRNENMVNRLDSLLKKTTVFAGVGAAHLPGEKGMIALLREKGYTVTPLASKQTNYAKAKKEELEKTFVETPLRPESTPDNFITLKSFDKLRELSYLGQKFYLALDVTNGAYLAITRINTYDYLSAKETISLNKIDNVLYEDIPGTIVKKETITTPFPGISVLNKTKKGDYQQYHIYRTPLEIIIIKFGGKLNYVLNNADAIFSSITFRPVSAEWDTLSAASGKYSMRIPQNHIIENYRKEGKKIIQSYHDDAYFFFQEAPVYDVNYIEEDAFEAAYLHESFYKNYDLQKAEGKFTGSGYSNYESYAKKDPAGTRKLYLKTIVKDDSYYLMGYEGTDDAEAGNFFTSFRFTDLNEEGFETVKDTSLHFSVVSNTRPGLFNLFATLSYGGDREKPYEQNEKETAYSAAHNEKIFIRRTKFHDLQMYTDVDSVWSEIDRDYKSDFMITNRKKSASDGIYTYAFMLWDTGSVKYIRVKNILKKGVLFELKTVEDSLAAPSEFVTRFYDTFTPADTLLGSDVFTDKTQRFFDALKRNDSIVLKSYDLVKFSEKNAARIMEVLSDHDFPDDRKFIKLHLIGALSAFDSDNVARYLADLYARSYADPKTQTAILRTFLNKNSEAAYREFLRLLESDFPLDAFGVQTLFITRNTSLKLKKILFPELLNYVTIEEYKEPVYELLAALKDSNYIRVKDYKKYKNQIVNDAKVEIKRNLGKNKTSFSKKNDPLLAYYVTLLFPFRNDKKTALFFNNLLDSDDKNALSAYYVLLKEARESIPRKLIEKTLENEETLYLLAEKLQQNKLLSIERGIDQQSFARSKVFENVRYNADRDSVSFIRESELHIGERNVPVTVYFYTLKQFHDYAPDNELLYYIAFEKTPHINIKPYAISDSGGIYIKSTKTIDDYIAEALEAIKHKTRKR
ncbi:MAG: TraB/GumN family protein, partial [Sinomicrobium sp.]|nr:TraB/GumN family protein [Sinomicrobium sp.]